ncbi:MAG: N-acetyl-gamma-glutamyl-phosphate reductase [Balneolaceae bacterium]
MIKVGIIGGAGYTAGELIRILLNHPKAELVAVQSRSHAGEALYIAHTDLEGDIDLAFSEKLPAGLDVVFLCSGHGRTQQVIADGLIPDGAKVIDLSNEFRLEDGSHDYVYGLPEINKERIQKAQNIANPGCFATVIELSLLPLAKAGLLNDDVHITAITGSTGAGQNPSPTTHFSWRTNNVSVYKAFTHQHLDEIKQSLTQLQPGFKKALNLIPMRGTFTRGILSTSYLKLGASLDEVKTLYKNFYKNEPFVHITETNPDVKRVANTNKTLLYIQKEGENILIVGVLDNLVKGASGQAVQNMNLMFGLDETTGLNLKSVAF